MALLNLQARVGRLFYIHNNKTPANLFIILEAYRGKENIDPMFSHERNIQKQKLYYGYPSQNENDNYGYSMNPLSYAASQQSCDSGPNRGNIKDTMTIDTRDLFAQQTPGVFRNASPKSPTSDRGHDDLARMYFNGPLE